MRHKRATDYGGRTPLGFWTESAFIALLALAFIALLLAMVAHAHGQPVSSIDIRVVDGDTIALSGLRQHIRLVGFNAPETRNVGCEAEAQLGQRAKQRLQVLVDTGSLELTFITYSCPRGTEATQRCNHGRRSGILRAEGRDVGSVVLMSEGLAVPFQCGKTSCPPTPRPWCRWVKQPKSGSDTFEPQADLS
jgi:micrococcal nuclease